MLTLPSPSTRFVGALVLFLAACGSSRSDPADPPAPISDAGGSTTGGGTTGDGESDATTSSDGGAEARAGCIEPAPTFDHDVLPILELRCSGCHTVDAGQWPLTDYEDVVDWEALLYTDLLYGTMPPSDAGALPDSERVTMLDWIACGMLR
jgi:hypothetical protein